MTLYSKLGSRFLVLLTGRVILLLLGLATIALLTRELGAAGFGVYRAAIAYLGLVVVLADLGCASIFVREISRDGANQALLVGSLLLMRLSISTLVMITAVLLSFVFEFDDATRAGILFGALGYVAYSAHLMLFGLFQQKHKQHGVVLAEIVGALLFIAVFLFLRGKNVPPSVFVGLFGASYAITFLISLILAARLVPIRLAVDRRLWLSTLQVAAPLALANILSILYTRADIILLALLHPPEVVGIYGVPVKISDSAMGITLLFVGLMAPSFAQSASRDRTEFAKIVSDGLGVLLMGTVGGSVLVFTCAEDILRLLGGSEFVAGVPILRILAAFIALHAPILLMREAIVAIGAQARLLPVYVVAVLIAAVAYAILVPAYGGVGAAVTLVVADLFVAIGVAIIMMRHAGARICVRVPLLALLCGVASVAISQLMLPQYWGTLFEAVTAGIVYLVLLIIVRALDIGRTSNLLMDMLRGKSSK